MNKKQENPLSVYAVVSQIGFIIITPLLLFIWGGSWLIKQFSLPDWLMIVFVILGLLFMICGATSYLMQLIKRYDKDDKEKYKMYSGKRDNDYFDDHKRP